MSSWNHTLRPFTAEELAYWVEREERSRERFGKPYRKEAVHHYECSSPRCHNRPVFHATYDYVTGRKGRVSWARKDYCVDHARKFAAKNDLPFDEQEIPAVEETPAAGTVPASENS